MARSILFVGAGHAHLYALARTRQLVDAGARVTLVAPGDFWYSGMGPGVLSGLYRPEEDTVDVARLVERGGGRFVRDRVARIDAGGSAVELDSGQRLAYDAMSLNVGSEIPLERIAGAAGSAVPVKPVEHYAQIRDRWERRGAASDPLTVAVVGAGAAGCETVANAWRLARECGLDARLALIGSAEHPLDGLPARAGAIVRGWLQRRGIEVLTGARVTRVDARRLSLDDGREIDAEEIIVATGVRPPRLLADSNLATDGAGALTVGETLRSTSHPNVLGGGDCIHFAPRPLDRVGVYAVRQGPVLHANLLALARGESRLRAFRPQRRYLLILNLGGETGLLVWGGLVLRGRWALRYKDWLDRSFIRKFQRLAAS